MRPAFVVSTAAVSFSACLEPTQITLEIFTDILCSDRPSTAIVVGSDRDSAEATSANTVTELCDNGRIGTLVLLPNRDRDKNQSISIRVVTGVGFTAEKCVADDSLKDPADSTVGCITARRTLSFIPSTPLFLPVTMRANCIGVICEPGTTCAYNGDCIPDVVDPNMCTNAEGCDLPGDNPPVSVSSSSSSSGMSSSGPTSSSSGTGGMSSSSSSSGIGGMGTGGMGSSSSSSGIGGMGSSSSSTGMGGTGGTGGMGSSSSSTGMGGTGGTGGTGGMGSSSSSTGMGGTGGPDIFDGGVEADSGLPVTTGAGGMGGFSFDGGSLSSSSSSSSSGLIDGGTVVKALPEMIIAPGVLVVGETFVLPNRRQATPRQTPRRTAPPLLLPLNTYPRNVKP